ncbi:MAG: copper resistance protein CopC [Gammaproteobacteria bacterium]|jgi:copper resistance protein C|nr:copper resistance protein CopC [Gammaproteobacteria bacterium]MBT4147507.1 copper resistance protein CopC [Gammaproteobacteria bacterium]MBT5221734.1 copper resistance protein CopC [Gammaproteobacteria bacterium]MBT5826436.1 copper resistance protein CopC [Gammaproteobacteria bacterium]MBT5966403.1 copper resistance protein CopC [Gammaproteobacteria bacterium]
MHRKTCHRQRLVCGLILLFCLYSGLVNAHAVVTDYSLKIEEVNAGKPVQVKLNFNSSIELGLSQVFLVRTGDVEETLKVRTGQEPGVVFINMPALDAGEYALHYKIFAADGHITEDIIHFTVQP